MDAGGTPMELDPYAWMFAIVMTVVGIWHLMAPSLEEKRRAREQREWERLRKVPESGQQDERRREAYCRSLPVLGDMSHR